MKIRHIVAPFYWWHSISNAVKMCGLCQAIKEPREAALSINAHFTSRPDVGLPHNDYYWSANEGWRRPYGARDWCGLVMQTETHINKSLPRLWTQKTQREGKSKGSVFWISRYKDESTFPFLPSQHVGPWKKRKVSVKIMVTYLFFKSPLRVALWRGFVNSFHLVFR